MFPMLFKLLNFPESLTETKILIGAVVDEVKNGRFLQFSSCMQQCYNYLTLSVGIPKVCFRKIIHPFLSEAVS